MNGKLRAGNVVEVGAVQRTHARRGCRAHTAGTSEDEQRHRERERDARQGRARGGCGCECGRRCGAGAAGTAGRGGVARPAARRGSVTRPGVAHVACLACHCRASVGVVWGWTRVRVLTHDDHHSWRRRTAHPPPRRCRPRRSRPRPRGSRPWASTSRAPFWCVAGARRGVCARLTCRGWADHPRQQVAVQDAGVQGCVRGACVWRGCRAVD